MSDEDTPPPMDDNSPESSAPPPSEPAAESSESPISDALNTEAPSTAGVGLGQGKLPENDEKTMALLAHVLGIATSFVAPLIIWLIKKEESPFVDDQGKEALNFQITMAIGYLIGGITMAFCVGYFIYLAAVIVSLVFGIKGAIESNKGVPYRYPFALRLVS